MAKQAQADIFLKIRQELIGYTDRQIDIIVSTEVKSHFIRANYELFIVTCSRQQRLDMAATLISAAKGYKPPKVIRDTIQDMDLIKHIEREAERSQSNIIIPQLHPPVRAFARGKEIAARPNITPVITNRTPLPPADAAFSKEEVPTQKEIHTITELDIHISYESYPKHKANATDETVLLPQDDTAIMTTYVENDPISKKTTSNIPPPMPSSRPLPYNTSYSVRESKEDNTSCPHTPPCPIASSCSGNIKNKRKR